MMLPGRKPPEGARSDFTRDERSHDGRLAVGQETVPVHCVTVVRPTSMPACAIDQRTNIERRTSSSRNRASGCRAPCRHDPLAPEAVRSTEQKGI